MSKKDFVDTWWEESDPFESVFQLVRYIRQDQSEVVEKYIRHARLYSNSAIVGLNPLEYRNKYAAASYTGLDEDTAIRLNVVSSVCDTISSKLAKSKPHIAFLPDAADFKVQQRTKKLERYVNGLFYKTNTYDEGSKAFMDALLFGTGCMKVFVDEDNICVERVLPSELVVDDAEAFYGKPMQMHQTKIIDKAVLIAMFPESEAKIEDAGITDSNGTAKFLGEANNSVSVIESWRLRSGKDVNDGRHTICIENETLFDEEYEADDFPFVFLYWKKPIVGFFGIGVVADIVGMQIEINKLLIKIQKSFHRLANPMVFVDSRSAINKVRLNNDIGVIVPYVGTPPIISTAQTVHPEVFQHIERLYNRAFEIAGVSQLAATSKKPEGLDSGTALREYNDIGSERFALVAQNYEAMFIGVAKKIINISRDLYSGGTNISSKVIGKKFVETISWKDVSLDDEQFAITVAASSSLPDTKAGRVQVATEWFQAQLIDASEWRELLDIPDLDDATDLARAPNDYIRSCVDAILTEDRYIPPEEMDNLQFAMEYAVMSYQRGKVDKIDEEKLQLLIQYIDDVSALQDQVKAQLMQEQQEEAAAMAPPMPQPQQQPGPAPKPQIPDLPVMAQ